ncbi:MAG: chromate transporter [Sphaerochaetaceae bacterium]|nr:chromate transporter [Sphaerochaetaceae bacterium]
MTEKENKTTLWDLFFSFAKIGAMTFGGGMSMLPMLQRECVDKRGWATEEQMLDYFAIGQCTPGIIAVNTATIIGKKQRGILGSLVSTLGIVTPSIIIIIALASLLIRYSGNTYVQRAFAGIRVSVCALIFTSIINLGKKADKNMLYLMVTLGAVAGTFFFGLSPIAAVIMTIVIGLIAHFAQTRRQDK